jgi:hypothetical protein
VRSSFGRLSGLGVVVWLALASPAARAGSFLFDATKHEMGGNADWIIDADAWNLNLPAFPCTGTTNESNPQRFPTPAQAGITPTTSETYWTGGISSWAVDLVKAGHTVETLPPTGLITFGDGGNPQDLSNYDVFIVTEPQNPFSAAEKSAILAFVAAGGGLFMVADHETSDRDCDGFDAPHVWNDLTGATSASATGLFGMWFRVDGVDTQGSEDWFDEGVNNNVETSLADPIIHGPFGPGTGGLGLFGSTSMDLNPADNPTAVAHVWRNGQAHGNLRATFATASYGSGRVAAIGDSSPADDNTGDPSDSLHPGWDKATGGVKNREIHLNACAWLLNPAPDVTPPLITSGPGASAFDCSASIAWTTDEPASSVVDYGPTVAYTATASTAGFTQSHAVTLSPLAASSLVHYRVSSSDVAGNGPTQSLDATFSTAAAAAPSILGAPTASGISGTAATISWTTDEPSSSEVQYGTTAAYGASASSSGSVVNHAVVLGDLTPLTTYHYRVLSTDACGNGPTFSPDATFTTAPASTDVSGWTLKQFNSTQSFTIPPGTAIPSGGYLVIARDATLSEFQAAFPSMPAATVFLNSNAAGSCSDGCFPLINGGETFELRNPAAALADGPTIAMSTTHRSYQRTNPGDAAGSPGSWNIVVEALANPGAGAGTASGSGIRINEMSDAADFSNEFIELTNDEGISPPDDTPPATITDLSATPTSSATVLLQWTASGDDGSSGTASQYDVRVAAASIRTEAAFAAASPLTGEPAPHVAGTLESFSVGSLSADTPYHFAMKVRDEAPNLSGLSNSASAVTALPGGSPPVPHLVVSQIRVSGASDDVIELYNPTSAAISLSGTSVQYLAANGNFGFRVNLTAANSVPAHGWYLVAGNGYVGSPVRDDSLGTSNMSNSAGHALFVSKTTNVSPTCSDAAIVDKVGYGATATCPEGGAGHATTTPTGGQTVTRKPGSTQGNGQDTNDNTVDFLAPAAAVFHNRFSTPATPPVSLGNVKNTLYLSRGASGATLEWANAAGATGYHVYRGTTADFMSGSPAPWVTAPSNSVVDGALPAPILFYVVRATDGTVDSAE